MKVNLIKNSVQRSVFNSQPYKKFSAKTEKADGLCLQNLANILDLHFLKSEKILKIWMF